MFEFKLTKEDSKRVANSYEQTQAEVRKEVFDSFLTRGNETVRLAERDRLQDKWYDEVSKRGKVLEEEIKAQTALMRENLDVQKAMLAAWERIATAAEKD